MKNETGGTRSIREALIDRGYTCRSVVDVAQGQIEAWFGVGGTYLLWVFGEDGCNLYREAAPGKNDVRSTIDSIEQPPAPALAAAKAPLLLHCMACGREYDERLVTGAPWRPSGPPATCSAACMSLMEKAPDGGWRRKA